MSNITAVSIYFMFAIFTAGYCISVLSKRTKLPEEKLFVFLGTMILGWTIMYMIWDLTEDATKLRFYYSLFYPFIAFVPPILLTMLNRFYLLHTKMSHWVLGILFGIPVLITIMSLTSEYHNLIFESFDVLQVYPSKKISFIYGKGFWVHTLFCYLVTLGSAGMIVYYFFKTPKYNRYSLILFAVGITITLLGNILTLMHIFPVTIDPAVVFSNLSAAFYYFAVINNSKLLFVNFSRQAIFDNLYDFVFILDTENNIIDSNKSAQRWLSEHCIPIRSLDDILQHFVKNEYTMPAEEELVWIDYSIETESGSLVFELEQIEILDDRDYHIGYVTTLRNVTQNRLLRDHLEKKAGIDALTGLYNRQAYTGISKRLNTDAYFPLSVLVCDVNDLKYMNDNYGHDYGDKMLKATADILEKCCPKQCFVARVGGDEFIYLLPNMDFFQAEELKSQVQSQLSKIRIADHPIHMAMGCATKESTEECFEDVVALADKRMYSNKVFLKSKRYR